MTTNVTIIKYNHIIKGVFLAGRLGKYLQFYDYNFVYIVSFICYYVQVVTTYFRIATFCSVIGEYSIIVKIIPCKLLQ